MSFPIVALGNVLKEHFENLREHHGIVLRMWWEHFENNKFQFLKKNA
jgi:hypothetical protein